MTISRLILSANKGKYNEPTRKHGVPGSDGAGIVEAVGSRVSRFQVGDKVVTVFFQTLLAGTLTAADRDHALGGTLDGTLRQYGVFSEEGLVAIPTSLDLKQASTLSCAALSAWNALYGHGMRALKPGDTVMTQGTGGVSIFALQVNPRRLLHVHPPAFDHS
jgi:NADPH:quinone reductase-like Zn-dependent oxidoreductase